MSKTEGTVGTDLGSSAAENNTADERDDLVPDPVVWREFGVTSMTGWRWDRDPELIALGWPPPIRIRTPKIPQPDWA